LQGIFILVQNCRKRFIINGPAEQCCYLGDPLARRESIEPRDQGVLK